MCRCTPIIRAPYCGRQGCEWPRDHKIHRSDAAGLTAYRGESAVYVHDHMGQVVGELPVNADTKECDAAFAFYVIGKGRGIHLGYEQAKARLLSVFDETTEKG